MTLAGDKSLFTHYFHKNSWGNGESVSGPGSTELATQHLVRELQFLLAQYEIRSILDAPCGDFNWMSRINLTGIDYLGADIVDDLIERNRRLFPERRFAVLDLVKDDLPYADLIICRDCFFHFPMAAVQQSLRNFKRSGAKYLLTTSFGWKAFENRDIEMGRFGRFNLELAPYNLPRPLERIIEGNRESERRAGSQADRCLCLWSSADLPD